MAYKARFLYVDDKGDYAEGMDGGIFITDVQPQNGGDVVDITWKTDTIGQNIVESVNADTELLTVTVEWDGVAYDWNGSVEIDNILVTNGTRIESTRRFQGSADVDLEGMPYIVALHNEGTGIAVPITLQGAGPEITDVDFIGGYPGSQTEVKDGDTFQMLITFNGAGSEPTDVEIDNYGAMKYSTHSVTWDGAFQVTIIGTIDATGNSSQALPARVRASNSFGTFGDYLRTNEVGAVDGTDTVNCNDLHPTVVFGTINYSSGFDALKDSETATVSMNTSNLDTIMYSSPNSELNVTNPTIDETPKTVTRIAGDYNVTVTNLSAVAVRDANGSATNASTVVLIANIDAVITVDEQSSRLRSGGNDGTAVQNHLITMYSNQRLRTIPTLSAPMGTLGSFSGAVPGTSFTASLTVHDNDTKGIYTWQSLSAQNLSGKISNIITGNDEYTLGGFVERDMYFDPQANEVVMGTYVSDTAKVVGLDKDLIAMTFYGDLADHVRGYSFTSPSGVINDDGNILYWNDVSEVQNNTTGLSFIRIREDV